MVVRVGAGEKAEKSCERLPRSPSARVMLGRAWPILRCARNAPGAREKELGTMTTNADTLMEEPRPAKGRGPGVTAINAILNLNEHPFAFTHLKYPNYNRSIPPGLFRYPWNTTAPVNWGADPN